MDTVSAFSIVHSQSAAGCLVRCQVALLRYKQSRDSLPYLRGPLSLTIPAATIAVANREEVTSVGSKRTEHGPYKRYSASVGAEIGKYASYHGVTASA